MGISRLHQASKIKDKDPENSDSAISHVFKSKTCEKNPALRNHRINMNEQSFTQPERRKALPTYYAKNTTRITHVWGKKLTEFTDGDTPGNTGPLVIKCLWHSWLVHVGSE